LLDDISKTRKIALVLRIFINFVAILLGFFFSINLSTALGQTGDWGIFSSGILVGVVEILSRFIYRIKRNLSWILLHSQERLFLFIEVLNSIKIGLLYGFFVEAFKLGS